MKSSRKSQKTSKNSNNPKIIEKLLLGLIGSSIHVCNCKKMRYSVKTPLPNKRHKQTNKQTDFPCSHIFLTKKRSALRFFTAPHATSNHHCESLSYTNHSTCQKPLQRATEALHPLQLSSMSSDSGARSKTRSTSKNESERTARYEKRSSPQSATAEATAAATIAATPTTTTEYTPEARCPELQQCKVYRCRRMDANYDICYYNELGEKTTQQICWRCRNKYKEEHKFRGGTIVSIIKTGEVDSETSDLEMEETEEPCSTTQRNSYDCQDLACLSGKPAQYIVTLKSPNEVFAKTKSICEDCLTIYKGKTHFGDEQIISVEKKNFDFSPKTNIPNPEMTSQATDATAKATHATLQITQILDMETNVTQKSEKEIQGTQAQKSNTESRDTEMSDASPLPPTPTTPNLTITANKDPRNYTIDWNKFNQQRLNSWVTDGCRKQDIPLDLATAIFDQYGYHLYEHPDYDSIINAWTNRSISLCNRREIFESNESKAWIAAGFPVKNTPHHILTIWKTLLGNRYPNISSGTLYARDILVLYNEYREFFPSKQIDEVCKSLTSPKVTPPQPATQGQSSTSTSNTKSSSSPGTVSFAEVAERANNEMERQARGSASPPPGPEVLILHLHQ